jgi:hypothetical protein
VADCRRGLPGRFVVTGGASANAGTMMIAMARLIDKTIFVAVLHHSGNS